MIFISMILPVITSPQSSPRSSRSSSFRLAAQLAPGAGGIKLSCALSTSSPHNYHMLPQHIIHHYSHYQVGDHSFNLCEFSSHAIPTTVKSIIFVSFQKHDGLGSKPFFASIVSNNKYCDSGWFLRYSYYSSVILSCI